jgi:hypothetical protein
VLAAAVALLSAAVVTAAVTLLWKLLLLLLCCCCSSYDTSRVGQYRNWYKDKVGIVVLYKLKFVTSLKKFYIV